MAATIAGIYKKKSRLQPNLLHHYRNEVYHVCVIGLLWT
jgi:hypothetical protein